jgi:spore germination protein
MAKRLICIVILASLLLLITGCWDRIEIEQRGFVIGVAVDFAKKKQAEQEAPGMPKGKRRFALTQQIVVPGKLQGGAGQGSSGSDPGDAYFNITSEGYSMFEITRDVAAKTSRSPFYQHIQIIVMSEEVAKSDQFDSVLDFFIRDPDMRRGTKVLIAKGDARSILNVQPKNEKLPVMYIDSISKNNFKNPRMLPPQRLGDVHEQLLQRQSYTIQRITGGEKEVKIAGNAVFHGHTNKMVGFLGEEETQGLNFITGEVKGGVLKFEVRDNLVIYEIKAAKENIKADVSDINHIEFTVTIDTEGNIAESFVDLDYLDPKILSNVEQKAAEEIERLANNAIQKLQKDFKTDAFGFFRFLKQEHYDTWQQIQNDWDRGKNYFSKSEIHIKPKVIVRVTGTINQSKY